MNIILDLALSADGFIAKKDGDSNWVSETLGEEFENRIREEGCLIVGRKTFEQYEGDLYPIEGAINLVVTSKPKESKNPSVKFVSSPEEAISYAKEKKCKGAVLVGGGIINGAFLEKNLINEIFFSIHPLILGEGIKPFGNSKIEKELKFLESKNLDEGIVQVHYKVQK